MIGAKKDMNPPSTYAEWCSLIDEIESSGIDHSFIDTIRLGKVLLNDVAVKRLYRNVCEMVQKRVNNAQKLFQRQVDSARGSVMAVSSAIKMLANEYQFVYLIVQNLPLMEMDKTALLLAISDQADQTQIRLKEIAIRSQNEVLVSLIYKSPINILGEKIARNTSQGEC